MSDESSDAPKRNWPLILSAAAIVSLVGAAVIGLVAMYVANFNLLEWIE
jgi:hypothetical protein